MIRDKVAITFIDLGHEPITLSWSIQGIDYVEQLVYDILESQGVGPVYRTLFGLRISGQSVWLAPNIKIQGLFEESNKLSTEQIFELRMRFRPSSFTKLVILDRPAFEIIFAQIRYDFIHTKFTDENRDFILLNESVLGLIATDLLRHAIEHDIDINEIFKRVHPDDFIPHRASKWQRQLLFHLREKLNLKKSVQIGYNSCDKDVLGIKEGFIELFLQEACKDYGAEIYKAVSVETPENPRPILIRVRYCQDTADSSCIIESKPISKSSNEWTTLCDIYSICYGTLRQNCVEINRSNGRPFRATFETNLHARSFLSLIDGYYRLMRKWHFNFCRDVLSPDLDYLKEIRSHGPIGFETMRKKLSKLKKPGTYLVRRCMEKNNRYMIDVLLQSRARLTMVVNWDPTRKVYTKIDADAGGYNDGNGTKDFTIILDHEEFPSLKELVDSTQIRMDYDNNNCPPQQLKHCLPPSEYDDCPALLLSISKKKFKELEQENGVMGSISELPRIIPTGLLHISSTRTLPTSDNKMIARSANLTGEQTVIMKEYNDVPMGRSSHFGLDENRGLILNLCHRGQSRIKFFNSLQPAQIRLMDWVFVKDPLFAENIGVDLTRSSLIQEFFPLGPLDRFLARSNQVSELTRQSISCQLAQALVFLQEKRIIHGKLRCHNIFLKSHTPIQIKVTDPLGTFDADRDQAFFPPEYFSVMSKIRIREYDTGIDVWAFGTTLWQVYSKGRRPPPERYANTLLQPPDCPDQVWSLIETCWILDPSYRASPQTIYRDLSDTSAWDREIHNYVPISQANGATKPEKQDSLSVSTEPTMAPFEPSRESSKSPSTRSPSGSSSLVSLLPSQIGALTKLANNLSHSTGLHDKRSATRSWRNIMPFRNNSLANCKKINYSDEDKNDMYYSKFSLSTCSTPSGSEVTKMTDVGGDSESVFTEALAYSAWQIDSRMLKLNSEIGRGSCGVVMKGVLSQWGGLSEQVVAVKCIDNKGSDDINRSEDLRREFEILKGLNHKNIVKTLGFVDEKACMMLVVEYMPLGSLLSCLKNSNQDDLHSLPLQKYAYDIAKGMEYLEGKKIVHRDLALRNILLKNTNEVKICDFGLAQFLGPSNHYKLKTDRALPLKWYAPEALDTWTFSHKTDVWSYGIVLWEIYSGGCSPQYSGAYPDLSETLKHERLLMPKDCPEVMYRLMLSCWAYNPDARESFSQICSNLDNISDNSYAYRDSAISLFD